MLCDASAPARAEPQAVLARDHAWKKWIYQNVSSLTAQHGKMLHVEWAGKKIFSSLKHPCSTPSVSYNLTATYSTVTTQTGITDWSSGFQFKLWNHTPSDCPTSFYPTHCKAWWESQTNRAGNNYATGSVTSFKDNTVLSTMFLKTSTHKGPTVFTQSILEPFCILSTRKIFLNLLFLATSSVYYLYSTHCGHCRFFFVVHQTFSCSPSSFKALILSISFYSCGGLLQYFSQKFGVIYLQVRGRKFPLELEHHQAIAGQNPSETIISCLPKITDSLGSILLYKNISQKSCSISV